MCVLLLLTGMVAVLASYCRFWGRTFACCCSWMGGFHVLSLVALGEGGILLTSCCCSLGVICNINLRWLPILMIYIYHLRTRPLWLATELEAVRVEATSRLFYVTWLYVS